MPVRFDLPKDQLSIIKVIGVGGGGSNAVNHMYNQGIKDVDFIVCNTDQQALDQSPVPTKIQLGATLTSGLGAGSRSEVGENAAIENLEDVKAVLGERTKMVFITAGMGGGTGTGAAPVIARAAKEMGILTVGIVTMPFSFEGKKRRRRAEDGMTSLRDSVDTLLVINNDKLRELFGNLSLDNAFEQADNVLTTAAKGIAEAITNRGKINVDFNDVKTVMSDSGVAILGSATAAGENRAIRAIEDAVNSPLLNDNEINGAAHILLNITYGTNDILMDEISDIVDFIEDRVDEDAEVIWGHGNDDSLEEGEISITVVATGFQSNPDTGAPVVQERPQRIVKTLDEEVRTELTKPIQQKPEIKQATIFEQPEEPKAEEPKVEEPKEESNDVIERPSEPAIARTVVFEEPVEDDVPTEPQNEVTEETTPEATSEPEEEKPIIRHTLEDDSWGSLQEVNQEQNSEPEEEVSADFDLEPTLKSQEPETPSIQNLAPAAEEEEEVQFEVRVDNEHTEEQPEAQADEDVSSEDRQAKIKERMARLRNLSSLLKSPSGIASIESEPAFKRRSIELDDVKSSNERQVSRFTLSESEDEDGDKKVEIKSNNSFLHDNVD